MSAPAIQPSPLPERRTQARTFASRSRRSRRSEKAAAAAGEVSAEIVAPYPPGVPVVVPGEVVTAEVLDALRRAAASGVRIAYAADPTLATLQVVA